MNRPAAELSFRCPKKWNSMTPVEGGRFCAQCQKTVVDFSNVPSDEITQMIKENTEDDLCGNFRAHQLNQPFGNWKDKLISRYQKAFENRNNGRWKHLAISFFAIALFLTGCHRRVAGKLAPSSSEWSKHNKKSVEQHQPVNSKSIGKKTRGN